MDTKVTIIAIGVSAIASSALTAGVMNMGKLPQTPVATSSTLALEVAQLREDLSKEIQAREAIQQQLLSRASSATAPASQTSTTEQTLQAQLQAAVAAPNSNAQDRQAELERIREQRRTERLARQQPGYRTNQLVEAGFAQEEAARIVQLESQESLRQLQQQYELRRARSEQSGSDIANLNPIRAELGDENYERYLEANGWPTAARIGSVIGGSPGENAGLRAGDQITSYAGQRVFNLNEINNLTVQGTVGESVLVEVERDGSSVQLTIPRGPIGVSSSGRGRFRR